TLASAVADGIRRTKRPGLYVECNSIAPQTAVAIARTIEEAGGLCLDAAVINADPRTGTRRSRYLVSGKHGERLAPWDGKCFDVVLLGAAPGRASALKMVYSYMVKGTIGIWASMFAAAEHYDVVDPLMALLVEGDKPVGQSTVFELFSSIID